MYLIKRILIPVGLALLFGCGTQTTEDAEIPQNQTNLSAKTGIELVVLGTAQDAGYPQANCQKACCAPVWSGERLPEPVVSLGIRNYEKNSFIMFEASPDLPEQLEL